MSPGPGKARGVGLATLVKRASQEIKQRIGAMQRGVGGITKGQAVTYTLSDGKKIQKVTEVADVTGSVVASL